MNDIEDFLLCAVLLFVLVSAIALSANWVGSDSDPDRNKH